MRFDSRTSQKHSKEKRDKAPGTRGHSPGGGDAAPQCARAVPYRRKRDLPGLLALWPSEIADLSAEARARVIAKLRHALRLERVRGAAGHWTYDLTRHAQLIAAYHAEILEAANVRKSRTR